MNKQAALPCLAFGAPAVDARVVDGLAAAALHDLYADEADAAAALGFGLLVAVLVASTKPILVVRDDGCVRTFGRLHGDGVADLGIDPHRLILVHTADVLASLRTAADAATCADFAAVVIQSWRAAPAFDLTASRRMALRARASGVLLLAVRTGAPPVPSAAATRWRVRAAPSTALAANAPGVPAFDLSLLHHRQGIAGFDARVEWNRDLAVFRDAPLPRRAPAVAPRRARDASGRRAA